jgi:phosphatidylserine decarboxylase
VIDVSDVDEPTFLGGAARRISIFLSVFDVHVQRAPVSGTVAYRSYRPGKYAVAWLEKASEDNEQSSLGIATPAGRVLVRQVAGLVARRIVTDPAEGERVERGARIGLIRFGSRVDLFLPAAWEVTCSVGDRARVGATVLARQPGRVDAGPAGVGQEGA